MENTNENWNRGSRNRSSNYYNDRSGNYYTEDENDWGRDFDERRYGSEGNWDKGYDSRSKYGNRTGWNDSYRRENDLGLGDATYGSGSYGRGIGSSNYGNRNYGSRGERDYDRGSRNKNNERDWWDRTTDEVSSWFGDEDAERRRRMDKMYGPNRGKGPKGYVRSDEKIRDDVNGRLYHDSYIDASDIEVTVKDGDVTLTGTVDSRETKHRAEDCAEQVTGVKDVSNNLKIKRSTETTSPEYGTTTRNYVGTSNESNSRRKSATA
jgi:osmotically-inducible protein OsmY